MINNLKTSLLINSMRNKVKNCTQLVGFLGSMVFMVNCGNGSTTSATPSGTGGGGTSTPCVSTPYTPSLAESTSTSVSHNAGNNNCLANGCHSGSYPNRFKVAGSFVGTANQSNFVTNGSGGVPFVTINGQNLPVDSCGNFYSMTAIPTGNPTSSTGGNMNITTLTGTAGDGNCNKGNCHDGGPGTRSYIY